MSNYRKPRWARKVSQAKIRQLYENDARGMVDETLIEEVGIALYARCESVLILSWADVRCSRCQRVFHVGWGRDPEELLCCPAPGCDWETTVRQYHNTWRNQDLIGGNAGDAFRAYMEGYASARMPSEKMLLIDQLIHTFH